MTNKTTIKIPQHVAIIPDGNRRWSKKNNFPNSQGHKQSSEQLFAIGKHAFNMGIKIFSIYALSKENLKRTKEELAYLFQLFNKMIVSKIDDFKKNNTKLIVSGRLKELSNNTQNNIMKAMNETKKNTSNIINICLNYGGRAEITDAVCRIVQDGLKADSITENTITKYLYAPDLPDPDLIIRTGGEKRLSEFLTWQSTYSELIFIDKYCPDFTTIDFDEAIAEFSARKRNFGK